ncbi:MAG: branched-chain amino acid ABC transporter permease [Acidimicrobiales bacterium]
MQVLYTGLSIGAIYGLVAMGYAVVFYVTRVINFATGELLMLSIMVTTGLVQAQLPLGVAVLVALVTSTATGAVIYFLAVRPVLSFNRFSFAWLVSTLGVGILLESMAGLIWGTTSLGFPTMLYGTSVRFFGGSMSWQQIMTIIVALVLTGCIELLRKKTFAGKLGMAVSADPETASAMGVSVSRYAVVVFALGGLLAGIAGVLVGPISFANPYLGETYGIYGFVALMIGGIESPAASMAGGLVLGVLVTIAGTYINSLASDWFPFVVVAVALLVAPNGIFVSGGALRSAFMKKPTTPGPRAPAEPAL